MKPVDYQYILVHRIKTGWFQTVSLVTLVTLCLLDGVEMFVLSLILPQLRKEWGGTDD